VTDQSINCHLAQSAMNYLLYYAVLNKTNFKVWHVFSYYISKTKNEFGQNPEENSIWTGSITTTNRENLNVKYNILKYFIFQNLMKTVFLLTHDMVAILDISKEGI
jgi:hypothetical protein